MVIVPASEYAVLADPIAAHHRSIAEAQSKYSSNRDAAFGSIAGSKNIAKLHALKAVRNLRKNREVLFSADLFSDPAWDIILHLAEGEFIGNKLTVSEVCEGSQVPHTTALRWINTLVSRGMIVREASRFDGRVFYCSLTESTFENVNRFIEDLMAVQFMTLEK